jgi:hypothetical protein
MSFILVQKYDKIANFLLIYDFKPLLAAFCFNPKSKGGHPANQFW